MRDPKDIRIVIPMGGEGQRFKDVGIVTPKPLIDIEGSPMVEWATRSIPWFKDVPEENLIFIVRQDHCTRNNIDVQLRGLFGQKVNVIVGANRRGAAATVLSARELIDDDRPVLVMDCDVYLQGDEFAKTILGASVLERPGTDGIIPVFRATGSQWSYSDVGEDNTINRVEEKCVISPFANIGLYYFDSGHDFVSHADKEVKRNRVCETYISYVITSMIEDGKKFKAVEVDPKDFHNLGTPEDLEKFRLRGSRSFNRLATAVSGALVKSSKDTAGLHNEYAWYKTLPAALAPYAPNTYGFEHPTITGSGDARFVMEYYGYKNLGSQWVNGGQAPTWWSPVIKRLLGITKEFRQYPGNLNSGDSYAMYVIKTVGRLAALRRIDESWSDLLDLNEELILGKSYDGWAVLKDGVLDRAEELCDPKYCTFIHGDFHLGNILFDEGSRVVKLLDPRGSFGRSGIYGDCRYDLAKLRHSIHGGYNHIVADKFAAARKDNSIGFMLNISGGNHRGVQRGLDNAITAIGRDEFDDDNFLADVRFIEGLLFLSMIPLHADYPKRQLAMFATAIQILNEELPDG